MSITKTMLKAKLAHQSSVQNNNNAVFMFDEQGKEVQVTASMIQQACRQLLKRCRTIHEV